METESPPFFAVESEPTQSPAEEPTTIGTPTSPEIPGKQYAEADIALALQTSEENDVSSGSAIKIATDSNASNVNKTISNGSSSVAKTTEDSNVSTANITTNSNNTSTQNSTVDSNNIATANTDTDSSSPDDDTELKVEVCYEDPNNPLAEQDYNVGPPHYE